MRPVQRPPRRWAACLNRARIPARSSCAPYVTTTKSYRAGTMERNVTLDFVRGVAILGILLLNISAFGLPKAAYLNPAWYGDITRSDAWTWAVLDLFAQVKFLTLFALLFGAGLQLLLKRGTRWIQSRLTLLVLLGFIHG